MNTNEYKTFASGPRKGEPKTLTDRVVRYLTEARNMREIPLKSRYRKFVHTRSCDKAQSPYFVGSNGAVRTGKNSSSSISITKAIHVKMRYWEKANADIAALAEQLKFEGFF